MGVRGELFSSKVILQNRSYFFNVKENRLGDLYLNIVESKNRDSGGFDRQSVILFAEDLQEFLKGFDESLKVMEKAVREKRQSGSKPAKRDENRSDEDLKGEYGRKRGSDSGEEKRFDGERTGERKERGRGVRDTGRSSERSGTRSSVRSSVRSSERSGERSSGSRGGERTGGFGEKKRFGSERAGESKIRGRGVRDYGSGKERSGVREFGEKKRFGSEGAKGGRSSVRSSERSGTRGGERSGGFGEKKRFGSEGARGGRSSERSGGRGGERSGERKNPRERAGGRKPERKTDSKRVVVKKRRDF